VPAGRGGRLVVRQRTGKWPRFYASGESSGVTVTSIAGPSTRRGVGIDPSITGPAETSVNARENLPHLPAVGRNSRVNPEQGVRYNQRGRAGGKMDERLWISLWIVSGGGLGSVLGGLFGGLAGALYAQSGGAAGTGFGRRVADTFARAEE